MSIGEEQDEGDDLLVRLDRAREVLRARLGTGDGELLAVAAVAYVELAEALGLPEVSL